MRILLTGASGQVGGALRVPLGAIGTVAAVDRSQLDLSLPATIPSVLSEVAPDLIINPAAYTAVDRAEDEVGIAHRVNAEAPGQIAAWARTRDIPLIHFSTDYVFDGSGDRPWREHDPTGPLSVYGASKLAGEVAIRQAQGPHLIVRTSWVYAAQGTNFLNTIARLSRERSELRIVADQIGAPTPARVIAHIVTTIVNRCRSDLPAHLADVGGIINVAASGETSWYRLATAIVDRLRARGDRVQVERIVPIRTQDYFAKARRPLNSRLDLTRLSRHFGIVPPSWERALEAELVHTSMTAPGTGSSSDGTS
jgi:dTDP-4-dehydrorhamnose reductase